MDFHVRMRDKIKWAMWLTRLCLALPFAIILPCAWLLVEDVWTSVFCTIFVLRYTRLVGHTIGYCLYKPSPTRRHQMFAPSDVSVILPTVDPNGPDFRECVLSILKTRPAYLFVVTVGDELRHEVHAVLTTLKNLGVQTQMSVAALSEPSKRRQLSHAIPHITTGITVLADDHVFWGRHDFLETLLAPFENGNVGVVATKKLVRRTTPGSWSWNSIVNFIACGYLQRHNWELRASNAIDGGVFVVSGRTAAYRTEVLQADRLVQRFCNERFFFGLFGGGNGLGPDDDNFLTREALKKGYLIRFQDAEYATIETTLGEWPKFRGQILRWARTTFRSNPVMLRDPKFLWRYTWSALMVYLAGITNFALLWDGMLVFSLVKAEGTGASDLVILILWMIATKTIKMLPHFARFPADIPLMAVQLVFGYFHCIFKVWALLTF